jgi:hypothetical protein
MIDSMSLQKNYAKSPIYQLLKILSLEFAEQDSSHTKGLLITGYVW